MASHFRSSLSCLAKYSSGFCRTGSSPNRTAWVGLLSNRRGTVRPYSNYDVMQNRSALVTGSTSGIGLGIARGLAARGCSIILNGFGDEKLIESLKDEFKNVHKAQVDYIYADLSKTSDIEVMCNEVQRIHPGGVDILVNNAGFQYVSPIEEFPPEKWDAMIAVMLSAPFHITRRLLPSMREKGWGRIVNISSAHGKVASPNKSAYVAAKHGLVGLTKVIALESAATGVTCNAICPGYVDTSIFQMQVKTLAAKKNLNYEEAKVEFLAQFHPSKNAIGINQLAETVAFLCSDSASEMTGSSIVIDGGWTCK